MTPAGSGLPSPGTVAPMRDHALSAGAKQCGVRLPSRQPPSLMPSLSRLRLALPLALALAVVSGASGVSAATPPAQPKEGPGGQAYAAASVVKRALGRAGAVTLPNRSWVRGGGSIPGWSD